MCKIFSNVTSKEVTKSLDYFDYKSFDETKLKDNHNKKAKSTTDKHKLCERYNKKI